MPRGAGGVLAAARRDPLHRLQRAPTGRPARRHSTGTWPGPKSVAYNTEQARADSVFPRRGVQGRFGAISQAFYDRFEATLTRVRKGLVDDEKHRNSTGSIDLEQRHLRVQARVPGVRFS